MVRMVHNVTIIIYIHICIYCIGILTLTNLLINIYNYKGHVVWHYDGYEFDLI